MDYLKQVILIGQQVPFPRPTVNLVSMRQALATFDAIHPTNHDQNLITGPVILGSFASQRSSIL